MKKKRKKRKKKPPIKRLVRKAWDSFSLWVRMRGSVDGENVCVTCGVKKPIKELQSGHFVHGHWYKSFIHEANVNVQCRRCNHFLSGNLFEYERYMQKTYGQEVIEEIRSLRKIGWKPTRYELEELIKKYGGFKCQ